MNYLNDLIIQKNAVQNSNVLMVYRYYDAILDIERVYAYSFTPDGLKETRSAICDQDDSGYWFMAFEEEYVPFKNNKEVISLK